MLLASIRCGEFEDADVWLLAAVTGLGERAVRRRVRDAHGNSLVRNVFDKEWPTDAESLGSLTVATARWAELGEEIAAVTGLGTRATKNRLEREHGKMLVRNAFPEMAPARTAVPPSAPRGRSPVNKPDGTKSPAAKPVPPARHDVPSGPSPGVPRVGALASPREGDIVDGRYRLGARLGGGGFGAAYEAVSLEPPRQKVVIKFALSTNPDAAARLEEEIKIAFSLKHQNIIAYLDRRVDPRLGQHLVLQHGGTSLSKLLGKRRGLAFALDVVEQVAAGLDYAHDRKVLHQDVKPGNIMVEETHGKPDVRIGDFGIAQVGKSSVNTRGAHTFVGTGPHAITPQYASPEQLDHRPARRAADQYSLARVLCALLEDRELPGQYQLPSSFPGLTAEQDAALRRALSEDPSARFPRCSDFVAALRKSESSSWRRALAPLFG